MDFSAEALQPVLEPVVLLVLFLVTFALGRWAGDLVTPYRTGRQLTEKDNAALALSLAGYYLGIAIIFVGAVLGPSHGVQEDAVLVFGYALGGIALLLLSRLVNDWLILRGFSARREIIEDRNPGAGAVLFGSYVASALVVAGAVHGEGGGPVTALVFWALGQVALVVFTWLYDAITPYSLLEEIENDNTAAGVGFGGALVAIGIIVMGAVSGDFVSWSANLTSLGLNVLLVFAYLIGVRFFFDKVVLSEADLNVEIVRDRNVGAGLLEFAVSVSFASVLFFVL